MDHYNGNGSGLGTLTAPRRNNYFYGKLMDELHFRMEQSYGNRKRWLLNRLSLGTGVLCGLKVEKVESQNGPKICVASGVAIDALGREIIVPIKQYLSPWTLTDACGQVGEKLSPNEAHQVHICLAYRECTADPMPVLVADCNTQEQCAPGTIMESFCLLVQAGAPDDLPVNDQLCEVLTAIADSAEPGLTLGDRRRSLCEATLGEYVTPSERPCVCLATVELKADGTIGDVDNCTCRPVVYSNTVLLELILCLAERIEECCGTPQVATKVLEIVHGDNQDASVGKAVDQSLVVKVSQNGAPVNHEPVTFKVLSGAGGIGQNLNALDDTYSTESNAQGEATLPIWVLGPDVGIQEVSATISDGDPDEVIFQATATLALPVIKAIWPPNVAILQEHADWLSSWEDDPHLELTFNRKMDETQVANPDPWLRLWEVQTAGPNKTRVRFIKLSYAGPTETSILGEAGVTETYKADEISPGAEDVIGYIVQVQADSDNIVDSNTPSLLLDADFKGTGLATNLLNTIWDIFGGQASLGQEVKAGLVDTLASLPSGDSQEGGRFHSWFKVVA
jgi:hypothetical protein